MTTAQPRPFDTLLAPAVGAGAFVALYLLLRPYGDAAGVTTGEAAAAFASPWWVVAHLSGALGLASLGRLGLRLADVVPGLLARAARATGLLGAILASLYYGLETFALHVLGRAALADPAREREILDLVAAIRDDQTALVVFALGLGLLAVCGALVALAWQRHRGSLAAWPLAVMSALVLPQYYLPPTGRMLFGVVYALAAAVLVVSVARAGRRVGC